MRHGDVGHVLQEAGIRRYADEELEFRVRRPGPKEGDQNGQENGAHGVDPPSELATAYGSEETEAVDEQVVPVVFP